MFRSDRTGYGDQSIAIPQSQALTKRATAQQRRPSDFVQHSRDRGADGASGMDRGWIGTDSFRLKIIDYFKIKTALSLICGARG